MMTHRWASLCFPKDRAIISRNSNAAVARKLLFQWVVSQRIVVRMIAEELQGALELGCRHAREYL
jgi:hypothetical protein